MRLTRAQKWFLRKWFLHGPFRAVAAPVYRLVIHLELRAERLLDTITPRPPTARAGALTELTALIKTFERPHVLRRLVTSIKRLYPDLQILVIDDSREPVHLPDVETIVLDYDSGLSAGRREGLRRARTRYFLLLDDDFVFYRHTRLEPALELMELFSEIDIMGGAVVDLPFFTTRDYRLGSLYPTARPSLRPPGSRVGELPVYDKVANFFVGRTDRVRLIDWDPELRLLEHADFFTRAKGTLLTVFNSNLKVLHARTLFATAYMKKRQDYSEAALVLERRNGRLRGRARV